MLKAFVGLNNQILLEEGGKYFTTSPGRLQFKRVSKNKFETFKTDKTLLFVFNNDYIDVVSHLVFYIYEHCDEQVAPASLLYDACLDFLRTFTSKYQTDMRVFIRVFKERGIFEAFADEQSVEAILTPDVRKFLLELISEVKEGLS